MKKVLLVADIGGHEHEKYYHVGDEAMFFVTYKWYRKNHPSVSLSHLSWFPTHSHLESKELPHLVWQHSGKRSFFSLAMRILIWNLTTIEWFSVAEKTFVDIIRSQDLIHFTGGGNLSSSFRKWLYYCFIIIMVAKFAGVPVVMTSQTLGPFKAVDLLPALFFLNIPQMLGLRTSFSFSQFFPKNGLFFTDVRRALDAAWFLPLTSVPLVKRDHTGQLIIGLSLHRWFDKEKEVSRLVSIACQHLIKAYDCKIVLIPHHLSYDSVNDDLQFMKHITSNLPQKNIETVPSTRTVLNEHNPELVIKRMTADVDILLTTRYHGVIFGLSSNVPTIALNYDQYYADKNKGAFRLFFGQDLSHLTIQLNSSLKKNVILHRLEYIVKNHTHLTKKLQRINTYIDKNHARLHSLSPLL